VPKKPRTNKEKAGAGIQQEQQVLINDVINPAGNETKKKPRKQKETETFDADKLTPAERQEVLDRVRDERDEKTREVKRANMQKAREVRAAKRADLEFQEKQKREDMAALKKKLKQGEIGKDGLPAIKPLSWLKQFKTEYEISNEDLRRLCMGFIVGHSIDELKVMASKENSHKIPMLVYFFIKRFIRDAEEGIENDSMENILDRLFGKSIVKEITVSANIDMKPKDENLEWRRAELERLEKEMRVLTGNEASFQVVPQ